MYIFNDNEQMCAVDCDDSLVLWKEPSEGEEYVDIIDPYDGKNVRLVKHLPHIKLLKDRFVRGCSIKVWSQAGPRWAKAVVDALDLQEYVYLVEGKPFMIIDDLPASSWMPKNTFLDPNLKYGSNELRVDSLTTMPRIISYQEGNNGSVIVDKADFIGVLNGR